MFCVYVDELLSNLRDKGCWFRKFFVAAIAYANDTVSLIPRTKAIRVMLSECDRFGRQHSLRYNATKSTNMVFVVNGSKHQAWAHIFKSF